MKILSKDRICTVDLTMDRHHAHYVELDHMIRFARLPVLGNIYDDVQIIVTSQGDQLTIGHGITNMMHVVMNGELTAMNTLCEKLISKTLNSPFADLMRKIKSAIALANEMSDTAVHETIDTHETDESIQLQLLSNAYLSQTMAELPKFVEEVEEAVKAATKHIEDTARKSLVVSRCVQATMFIFVPSDEKLAFASRTSFCAIRRVYCFGEWKYAVSQVNSMGQIGSGVYFSDSEKDQMLEFLRKKIFNYFRRSIPRNQIIPYETMIQNSLVNALNNPVLKTSIKFVKDCPLTVEIADLPGKSLN